jgi:hypothetical protein
MGWEEIREGIQIREECGRGREVSIPAGKSFKAGFARPWEYRR